MKRILTLASGRGSNFKAVVGAIQSGRISGGAVIGLITDRRGAGAQEFADREGIPAQVVEYSSFPERTSYNQALEQAVDSFQPDLILTLGYMRILAPELTRRYSGRIINIHPSLLPAFTGLNAQKQAWEYGVRFTGATVHYVDDGVDTGPIILQAAVAVPEDAGVQELADLILVEEHRIIVEAVALHCADALSLEGRKIKILK